MRIGDVLPNETTNKDVPWYQQILSTLTQAGQTYLTIEQQRELNKMNLQRAQQGLPAIDVSMYQAGVNVGISRSTQNTLLTVAAVGGGVWLLTSLLSPRRRR